MRKQVGVIGAALVLIAISAAAQTNTFPASGNVGIGTTSPSQPLEVNGNAQVNGALQVSPFHVYGELAIFGYNSSDIFGEEINNAANGGDDYRLEQGRYGNGTLSINDCTHGCAGRMTILSNGSMGIGTSTPGATLEVNGNVKLTAGSGASITFQDGTTQSTAYTGVTCGGDYAESVDVSGGRKDYAPGDVLVIDPDHSGNFLKSAEPYSTSVTGIYSTKPGTVGRRQTGPRSPDEVPMAMIGIVPTKVSAENGPIHPGDLLVTSSTIGYAMKGTDRSRMLGAVIGKALGSLDSGKGVIEIVVTLQ